MDSVKKIAFVPIRKGSKGIVSKNTKILIDRPLVCWVLDTIVKSKAFDEIIVASDCDSAKRIINDRYGSHIRIFDRSAESATDDCNVGRVVHEFLQINQYSPQDIFVLFQATSPFTSTSEIDSLLSSLYLYDIDGVIACNRLKRFRWSEQGECLDYTPQHKPMRQQYPGFLVECGAFYAARIKNIVTHYNDHYVFTLSGKIAPIEVSNQTAVDIDEPIDWTIAEHYANKIVCHGLSD